MADVASTLNEWSTTASSNSPSGSTSVGSGMDDNLREIQAVVKNYLNSFNGTPIASSGTCNIGEHSGLFFAISGTTTITSFGTPTTGSMWKICAFLDALVLTHNATSLVLPGAENITTALGDYLLAYHRGSGNWTVPFYQKASGSPWLSATLAGTAAAALSTDSSPDWAADFVLSLDTSAGTLEKILLNTIVPVGAVNAFVGTAAPTGWLLLQGGTIGNASSGGSALANADAAELFTLLWNSMADGQAPVSTGRGANAAADFAANKTITLPNLKGRSILGTGQGNTAEGGGAGTSRTHGHIGGAETHTLVEAEMPSHSHGLDGTSTAGGGAPASYGDSSSLDHTTSASGGDDPHANMHPWLALNYIIKY